MSTDFSMVGWAARRAAEHASVVLNEIDVQSSFKGTALENNFMPFTQHFHTKSFV